MQGTAAPRSVDGRLLGLAFPPDIESLADEGPLFLTKAFRAAGVLGADNHVAAITEFVEFYGGGMGRKLMLSVTYGHDEAGLQEKLFVKFPRDFADPLRALFGPLMEPEVRFALLSRREGFPIAVPACFFADYDPSTTSGILITERIGYGESGIEPRLDKCLDHERGDLRGHYQALTTAMARLAAAHKSGGLGRDVDQMFPFDPAVVDSGSRIPYTAADLAGKLAILRAFAAEVPCLFPHGLGAPAFLDRFADETMRVLERQDAIRAYLNQQQDCIALCHWNMNVDNAWFRRDRDGVLEAGLLDWGSVGQMNVAQAFYGMICAAETAMLDRERSALMAAFVAQYAQFGGPVIALARFEHMVKLAIAVLGIAWILDAPSLVRNEIPEYAALTGRDDPRLRDNFLARAQMQLLIVLLNEWRALDIGAAVAAV